MKGQVQPMPIRFISLVRWVVPMGLLVGLAGAYPTWRLGGRDALLAEAWAGGIVLSAVLLSALLVAFSATAGPSYATLAFVMSGLGRMIWSVALGMLVVWKGGLPATPLFVWLAGFYFAMLPAEGAWLARALRRCSAEPTLEEVLRSEGLTQMDIE